jgi:hypothetical protein
MDNAEIKSLKTFFHFSLLKFYRMGLQVSGKTFDDVIPNADGELFWREKDAVRRTFGRKLNQLLNERR